MHRNGVQTVPLRFLFLVVLSAMGTFSARGQTPLDPDRYNQWKDALKSPVATPAEKVKALPGFRVELLRSSRGDEGSWVALAFDPKGRLIISREERGLLRLTLTDQKMEVLDNTLLEVRGLLFAHGALYANANNSHALYRLRDTDGDDHYDEVKLLRATSGGVGHGRNQLALGPDGMIYSIHGDDVGAPEGGFAPGSPFRDFRDDKMLPASWDKFQWNDRLHPPAGHLVRTDPDGKTWELVCGGLRNPFGIAFNASGEPFTYDADMEWDVGLPWYHPTRVVHLVSGADYGWRGATRPLPPWMPDIRPAAADGCRTK